ncbi:MAG: DUF6378 domain-containing protein [Haemophilus parainfluenzae]|uniref:DUF6378 domain-containing protein n=1 Tax=uncultured Haemophilus sp. TaxID=237779 RepID=UPI0028061998|nr:DUF6378 domain-containing protein [uncultured Haemophilus sp.]MDU4566277.1 DUF6378 domain-containing protein [Haemophilus parainfluenzae]MDU4638692.1 DUF6378 domain-containing protein [Haemophilus parainfluenzae]MDU5991384.1 DUF6378 domain-containing protein [Haemophilus parainfluenzae]
MKTTEDILNERSKTHGDFIQGSVTFNALMELINNNRKNIDGVQYYALTMIAGKIVRILNGNPHETDHWSDIIGYATLGGRLELAQEVQEPLVDILPVANMAKVNHKSGD